ncbi:hypothetical protein DICPUDRAFT_85489 [Dictyostelium purpureum]|uniref:Uncharacterized protein n=1 Tax=Dictyostelium purpureum TaxID=5786 RepID=F1A5W7_DICPU|nr:uncharacterized protein DICPUDRAFT_85489 [Dictyostelium purpureum]EGC28412.1 hypothetical protein DICPUDRAFT_85489 [Dictyostelium purpureum]|eukprot:XP_003295062.1 hypothetical protein DICPUDRAFT_85489 [Dictyostelium purpureum]
MHSEPIKTDFILFTSNNNKYQSNHELLLNNNNNNNNFKININNNHKKSQSRRNSNSFNLWQSSLSYNSHTHQIRPNIIQLIKRLTFFRTITAAGAASCAATGGEGCTGGTGYNSR